MEAVCSSVNPPLKADDNFRSRSEFSRELSSSPRLEKEFNVGFDGSFFVSASFIDSCSQWCWHCGYDSDAPKWE
jgi:hypothetical protein